MITTLVLLGLYLGIGVLWAAVDAVRHPLTRAFSQFCVQAMSWPLQVYRALAA